MPLFTPGVPYAYSARTGRWKNPGRKRGGVFTPTIAAKQWRQRLRELRAGGFVVRAGRTWPKNVNAFMDEWYEGTQANPFDPRIRLRGMVGIEMAPWSDPPQIHISSIISFGSKNKGEASSVMREVTEMADQHGVVMDLTAKPIPNAGAKGRGLNQKQLIEWYKKFGFEPTKGMFGGHMTRFPKKT